MKYIVLSAATDGLSVEVPCVFPVMLSHDVMADHLRHAVAHDLKWEVGEVVGAGFLSPMNMRCHGESDTLGVASRGREDTEVILMCDYGGMFR